MDANSEYGLQMARELGLPVTQEMASLLVDGKYNELEYERNPDGTINILLSGKRESQLSRLNVSVEEFSSVLRKWLDSYGGN